MIQKEINEKEIRAERRGEKEGSAQSGRRSRALAMSLKFSTSVLIPLPRPST
jgi:hypothetical protein